MFTVTVKNVHDRQLGALIAAIGTKRWSVRLTHHDDLESSRPSGLPNKKSMMAKDQILSMTGKKATEGSMREQVLETMERLEKKNGIGSVTRAMLKEELIKKKQDTQILYQLVREGYLKKL